jgi:FkbM family methyltransferase
MLDRFLQYGIKKRIKGFGYITSKIYRQGIIAKNDFGIRLMLDPYQLIDYEVLEKGYFDREVLDALVLHLKKGDIFWDIGANMGLHSYTVKKLRDVECHSFEPFYANFNRLISNQLLNPGLHVNKYNFGLSDKISIVQLYSTTGNHGITGFSPKSISSPTGAHSLAVTGDFLISKGFAVPDVIKIDTEGHELQVLRGCENLLKSPKLKAIIYETIDDRDAIRSLLEDHGFSISPLDTYDNFLALR